jgi:hypothetical protein
MSTGLDFSPQDSQAKMPLSQPERIMLAVDNRIDLTHQISFANDVPGHNQFQSHNATKACYMVKL